MRRSRQIAAEALRLRAWCRSRLIDRSFRDTPRAQPDAWRVFLQQERCAAILVQSLADNPPRYAIPDFVAEMLRAAIHGDPSPPDPDTAPVDIAWSILHHAVVRDPCRRYCVRDLFELRNALLACDASSRISLDRRIARCTLRREHRRMMGAIQTPRNTAAVARHYLVLARTRNSVPPSAIQKCAERIAVAGVRGERARQLHARVTDAPHVFVAASMLARMKTWDVGLLRRRTTSRVARMRNGPLGHLYRGIKFGAVGDARLKQVTATYYDGGKNGEHIDYAGDTHNLAGWFNWEEDLVGTWFPDCGNVLVVGAGGGREMIALAGDGYNAHGLECNAGLAKAGVELMRRQSIRGAIDVAPPDYAPSSGAIYDAAILGWSAYTHVRTRVARIQLLREINAQVAPGAPLMLSFFTRTTEHDAAVMRWANLFRRLRRAPLLEPGDELAGAFTHLFTRSEIEEEMRAGGWNMVAFGNDPTGFAVGFCVRQPPATPAHPADG